MKKHLFLLSVIGFACFTVFGLVDQLKDESINPLLGDISFERKFGNQPTVTADEDLRISTHLEYVEDLLRKKATNHLTPALREKRFQLLDLLHEYRLAGNYPRNFDHPEERRPCFIDRDGRICAVGYLIEHTAGRKTAEQINSRFQYEKLLAMKDQTVDGWVASSGLSKEECAMIQPAYGPSGNNNNYISPGYGFASSLLGGINLSLNTINVIQINKGRDSQVIPLVGLLTGASSMLIGAVGYAESDQNSNYWGGYTNESQKILSMVNIGLGTSTMILSACNLATKQPKNEKAISWNVYSIPAANNQAGVGFSLSRRF